MPRPLLTTLSCLALLAAAFLTLRHLTANRPLTIDKHGVAHGTGRKVYKYRSGATKLIEDYVNGKQSRSEWFRPDGTSILVTNWQDESGVCLYLREDGTIKSKLTYVRGLAHGPATFYDKDGTTVLGEAIYENGARVSGYEPKPEPTGGG